MNNTKKKICYVLPKYDANTDTHFSYQYDLLNNVSDDLDIFLIIEKCVGDPNFKGVNTVVVKSEGGNAFSKLFESIKLAARAYKEGYKDFYVHYSFTGALSALFITRGNRGRVFYWNCGMPWLYKRPFVQETIFKFILRKVYLVTGTASLKDSYIKEYDLNPAKPRVLHNWINLEDFNNNSTSKEDAQRKLRLETDKPVVLFVHHLSKRKGADKIIPTVKMYPEGFFIIVGDGPYTESLKEEIAKDENVRSRVRVEGRKPQNEIPLYLSACDVFFMPSEEEGFPHVLLEAMALGVPYVASDVGSVRDISPDFEQEYIYTERTPRNFAKGIEKALTLGDMEARLLKDHVLRYDIKPISKMFIDLF